MELALTLIAFSGALIVALITGLVAFLVRRRNGNPGSSISERLCEAIDLMIKNQNGLAHYLEDMESRAIERHTAGIKEILDWTNPRRPAGLS